MVFKRQVSRILLVVALVFLLCVPAFITSSAQESPEITTQWLNQEIPVWQASPVHPLTFSAEFTSASYDNINSFDQAALNANLNLLYASGASTIRMDVGYDAWLSSNQTIIGELDNLAQNITGSGRQLVLADAGANYYFNNPVPWTQFQADWIQRVTTLAAEFKPAYYIVVKEPGYYVSMVSDATTNPQFQNATVWLQLVSQLATAVHSVSPNTKVGVSIAADVPTSETSFYQSFLTGVEADPQISFVGFDIYNIPGFDYTQSFLNQYGSGGKAIWIAEAWSGVAKEAVNASRSSLDTLWMQGLYYYALTINASLINPFFTDLFASYQQPPTDSQGAISYFAGRTPVFKEFQAIQALNAQATSSSTSSTSTTTLSSSTTTLTTASTSTSSSSKTSTTTSNSSTTTAVTSVTSTNSSQTVETQTSTSSTSSANSTQTSETAHTTTSGTGTTSSTGTHSVSSSSKTNTTIAVVAVILVVVAVVAIILGLRRGSFPWQRR